MSTTVRAPKLIHREAPQGNRVPRSSKFQWVAIPDLVVDPDAQRPLRQGWVDATAPHFDPDKLGIITVNRRNGDGKAYVVDGQHRVALVRAVGWGDQQIHVEIFEGLSQAEEAALFLDRNRRINVSTLDKFRVRVTAGEEVACDIARILRHHGLHIANGPGVGRVNAAVACENVYRGGRLGKAKDGPAALSKALKMLVDAYGRDHGNFEGMMVEGLGLVCLRYGSALDAASLTDKLAKASGGVSGLIGRARSLRDIRGGNSAAHCMAAVLVDLHNKGRRGAGKLEDWWA